MRVGSKVKIKSISHKNKPLKPMQRFVGSIGKIVKTLPKEDQFDFEVKLNATTLNMKRKELEWLK